MGIHEIKNMTTTERLEAMELLWDALCHEDKEISSPTWHESHAQKKKRKNKSW